jgi:ubiquitin-activating enzyme E1
MTELNNLPATQVEVIDGFSFKLKVDATGFGAYTREGQVENVKVPKTVAYHSLKQSIHNPIASSASGMLETPDLRCWGRSDQLHIAFHAILDFQKENNRFPDNNCDDVNACLEIAKRINESNKANEGITVEELETEVLKNAFRFAKSSLSPMAAFFGGVVA